MARISLFPRVGIRRYRPRTQPGESEVRPELATLPSLPLWAQQQADAALPARRVPAEAFEIRLLPLPQECRRARDHARRVATAWGLPDEAAFDAALIASELAANAIRHARPTRDGFAVIVALCADVVRIEVRDGDPAAKPRRGRPGPRSEAERGLDLVARLAGRWGFGPCGDGRKAVWAELKVPGAEE